MMLSKKIQDMYWIIPGSLVLIGILLLLAKLVGWTANIYWLGIGLVSVLFLLVNLGIILDTKREKEAPFHEYVIGTTVVWLEIFLVFGAIAVGSAVVSRYWTVQQLLAADRRLYVGISLVIIGAISGHLYLHRRWIARTRHASREHAEQMFQRLEQRLCVSQYEYDSVDASSYAHLDLTRYDEHTSLLKEQGFVFLDDGEIIAPKQEWEYYYPAFSRLMVGEEGTMSVMFTLLHPRLDEDEKILEESGAFDEYFVECMTEFSDGVFLSTCNQQKRRVFTSPPTILLEDLVEESPLIDVVQRHRQRIQEYQEHHPACSPCKVHTVNDVVASLHRYQHQRFIYRKTLGIITEEEFRRLTKTHASERFVEMVWQEIQHIKRTRLLKEGGTRMDNI